MSRSNTGTTFTRRRVLLIVASGLFGLAICLAVYQAVIVRPKNTVVVPPASSVLGDGSRAPSRFVLARLGGGAPLSLKQAINGQFAVVNFFASWCTACASELSAFGAVSARYGDAVRFVGIDTNESDRALAISLLAKGGVHYPVGLDTSQFTVATAYGVDDLPATFFINKSGRVVGEVLGAENAATLSQHISHLFDVTDRG